MTIDVNAYYQQGADRTGQLEPEFQKALQNYYAGTEKDCLFYHTVEFADGRQIVGATDLLGTEKAHLGGLDLTGKRVVEFGGASGWLTAYLADRASEVVTLDAPPGREELSAPFAGLGNAAGLAELRNTQERVRKGWWFVKAQTQHRAKMVYCDLQSPPSDLGRFDVAVLPSTLQQQPLPFLVLQAAASCTDWGIAVSEPINPSLQQDSATGAPSALFAPNLGTERPNHWWNHSAATLMRMLMVVGFGEVTMSAMVAPNSAIPLMTVVGRKQISA